MICVNLLINQLSGHQSQKLCVRMTDGRDEILTMDEMCDDGPRAFVLQEYYEHERVRSDDQARHMMLQVYLYIKLPT